MLKVSDDHSLLLRRPFSVYQSFPDGHREKKKRGSFTILYKTVGKGTYKMAEWRRGLKVELIGPLGNGFDLPTLPSSENQVLVGGGMGIASLFSLTEALGGENLTVFIGGRTQQDILCVDDFERLGSNVLIATEDGSLGTR